MGNDVAESIIFFLLDICNTCYINDSDKGEEDP